MKRVRSNIQLIFKDPYNVLNCCRMVADSIIESFSTDNLKQKRKA